MGYCPFSNLGHDTIDCIMTQARRGAQKGATIWPATLRHSPTIRPGGAATQPACLRSEQQCARCGLATGERRNTKILYRGEGKAFVSRHGAQCPAIRGRRARHGARRGRHGAQARATWSTVRGMGSRSRYNFFIVTGGRPFGLRYRK